MDPFAIRRLQQQRAMQAAIQQRALMEQQLRQQRFQQGQGVQQQRLQQSGAIATDKANLARGLYDIRAREAQVREADIAERAKERQDAAVEKARGALPKDFRWKSPTSTESEVIPGSKTYNQWQQAHSGDANRMRSIDASTKELVKVINYIQDPKNKAGFEANFGGLNAYVTRWMPSVVPGFSHTGDVRTALDRLEEQAQIGGLGNVRGVAGQSVGQITEREWPKFASQLLKVSPYQEEDTARDWLQNAKQVALDMRNRELAAYKDAWKDRPFYNPNVLSSESPGIDPAEALRPSPGGLPPDKEARYQELLRRRQQGAAAPAAAPE